VFLVRRGNPLGIHGWDDLVKPGVKVVAPNPKVSGGARWIYLAAWAHALGRPGGDERAAEDFVRRLYANGPVLDSGARAATTTFAERGLGDVLVTWENEAYLALRELGDGKVELVTPPDGILAEPKVAVVDENVDRHGTRAVAEAYLRFLYSEAGQRICVKYKYRARGSNLPAIRTSTLADTQGSWSRAHARHFATGALFDRMYQPR
jgi:sulfate transport system substrate-binding protein